MTTKMTIEEIMKNVPEVSRYMEQENQRARDQATNERSVLISKAVAAESALPDLERQVAIATEMVRKIERDMISANRAVADAQQKVSDQRSIYSACLNALVEKFGNDSVNEALVKLGAIEADLKLQLRNAGSQFDFSPHQLAGIQGKIALAVGARVTLEGLIYADGHPDEISLAANEALAPFSDDLAEDDQ